jgi:hypothetical protein
MRNHAHWKADMDSPRFGRVPDGLRRSGLSRAKLYQVASEHPGLFKKAGSATIVDLEKLDQILADLPAAEFKPRQKSTEAA